MYSVYKEVDYATSLMDCAFCSINLKSKSLEYSEANNPFWILRKDSNQIEEIKANKQPIGSFEFRKPFDNHKVKLSSGDIVYFFPDGYVDQFGGPKGKKLKYKSLKNIILEIRNLPMDEQETELEKRFSSWKGELEQLDDVCIIGVKF